MKTVPYIVATAGHVDHGKSALVRALTGTDPDRLPEEKARGITIDLGFAALSLQSPDHSSTFQIGIVDVPGHEDFVKNMVAGVGSIDMALLIVAADDGWMPQTEEHLQILTYLGVRHAVVALTKSDLATNLPSTIAAIREKLQDSPFAEAPIVPTSVPKNTGIEELKDQIARVLSDTPPPRDIAKPRLAVDRVFTLKGIGTVVTGTLTGGSLQRGQQVIVQPTARRTHIRSIQTHNREIDRGLPGSRVALNLPDLKPAAARAASADSIRRGDVITLPELGSASKTLDVLIVRSPRLLAYAALARPLKAGAIIQVHHGSGAFPARVTLFDRDELPPGETMIARLIAEQPVYAFAGDHFVIRDWPEQHTLAGGIILDPQPESGGFRKPRRQALLRARASTPLDPIAFVSSQIAHDGYANRNLLLPKSRFSRDEIANAVNHLVTAKSVVASGDILADAAWWTASRRRAIDAIDAHHQAHPEQSGLALADLRQLFNDPAIADALVADLCRDGFARAATSIRRATHRPSLPPRLASAGARLRSILVSKAFDPPSRKELAPDDVTFQALKFLIASGEAVEVAPDVVLGTDAYAQAVSKIRDHLRKQTTATVSELKTLLGSSRRIMVPLLERLDREGITRRQGDQRLLK